MRRKRAEREQQATTTGVSRRGLIRGLGVGALGAGVGAAAAVGADKAVVAAAGTAAAADRTYPFHGSRQAGITKEILEISSGAEALRQAS